MTERLPIALDLNAFLGLPIEERPPLLGVDNKALLPAGGLALLGGKAGLGKTTLVVDAIFHFASGLQWLNFPVPRPLNILVIENEGPLPMFQQKLAAKHAVWTHEITGGIHIQTGAWGWFSFADNDHHAAIASYLDDNQIDLVIGDPIGTLGMEGVGSPEDTRTFVRLLVPLGLFNHRAFLFPVHFTKEPRKDEVDQISGAWGGHLDTLMVLKATRRKDELRLSFPKLRWWNETAPKPLILGKVYNTQGFEILREEGDVEPLEERIIELLSHGQWLTLREISNKNTGIEGGARQADVKALLEARPDLFRWEGGADHGRHATAVVWQLIPASGSTSHTETAQPSQTQLLPANGSTRDDLNSFGAETAPSRSSHNKTEHREHLLDSDSGDHAERSSQSPPYRGLGTTSQAPASEVVPETGSTSSESNGVTDDEDRWLAMLRDGEPELTDQPASNGTHDSSAPIDFGATTP